MTSYELRMKIFYSVPVQFIVIGLVAGLVAESLSTGSFSLKGLAVWGAIFGAVITAVTRGKPPRITQVVESPEEQWKLEAAIRAGKPPRDPKLHKIFPAYLQERDSELKKNKQQPLLIALGLAAILCLVGLFNHKAVALVLSAAFLALGCLNYFLAKRLSDKVTALRKHL